MNVGEKEAVGIGALVLGWLSSALVFGRAAGKIEERYKADLEAIQKVLADHAEKIAENQTDIEEVRKAMVAGIGDIRAFFSTSAGGQKFITFPDHDLICARNMQVIIEKMGHLTEAVKKLTEQSEETADKVSAMTVDIAVLKAAYEKRSTGP
jgi:hypothetical protein